MSWQKFIYFRLILFCFLLCLALPAFLLTGTQTHLQGRSEQKPAPGTWMPVEEHISADTSPSFSLNRTPTVRKRSVPLKAPSAGASSEEQQHFKWNVRFSRHTVINFSSASGFEAGEGAGQPGSNFGGFQRRVCGVGELLEWGTTKILCFTIYEQRGANKVGVQRLWREADITNKATNNIAATR